jgi:hypothetical protein
MRWDMDKLEPMEQNLGRFFNSGGGCAHAMQFNCFQMKLANLKLKTQPSQLLVSPSLDIELPG